MKPKFPRADAIAVAKELCGALKPWCERLLVAGSLRRRRAEVGDVEIVYIPRKATVELPAEDLFDAPRKAMCNQADTFIEAILLGGTLRPRQNVKGATTWGEWNKLALHIASGIPVDLFATTEAAWFNYVVCRTGGAESNTRIAGAALARGWKWHPTQYGFERRDGATRFIVRAERDVFDFVGMPYLEPWQRE